MGLLNDADDAIREKMDEKKHEKEVADQAAEDAVKEKEEQDKKDQQDKPSIL